MSRNGSGTFSIPNTLVSGTTITAADHNENYSDIASEITNSVAADGQTTMTGPLKASSGTVSAPSHTFGSDTDTGGYRSGANEYSVAAGGVQITKVSSAGLDIKSGTLLIAGVEAPAIANGAALSVFGVTGNATAAHADIAAGVDGYVLRRSGTALGFGTVATAGLTDGAVTLAKQADLAAGAFIVRYTASTGVPQAGSFGSTLSLNTSTGALNVALPAAKTFLSSQTASSSSAIAFTSGIDSTYREYEIAIDAAIPATDAVTFLMEVSVDGGSNWKTTGYLGGPATLNSGAGSGSGISTTAFFLSRASVVGNTASCGWNGQVNIHAPSATGNKVFRCSGGYIVTGGAVFEHANGAATYNGVTTAINAIRFRMSSGNIASGQFTLYGIKGS